MRRVVVTGLGLLTTLEMITKILGIILSLAFLG